MKVNVETLAVRVFVALATESEGWPPAYAEKEARRWVDGIRDHNVSDFTAVHMPRCHEWATLSAQQIG